MGIIMAVGSSVSLEAVGLEFGKIKRGTPSVRGQI